MKRTAEAANQTTPIEVLSPAKQQFNELAIAPPLPIIDISRVFVLDQAVGFASNVKSYVDRALAPLGLNSNTSDLILDAGDRKPLSQQATSSDCGPGSPCPDGSCCNKQGKCGFGLENCGNGNCTSNCM